MRTRRGFTLIEILVVVAIIALLVAILLPSLGRARTLTRRLVCTSNVRQIVVATNMYAMQHPRGQFLVWYPRPPGKDDTDEFGFLYPRFIRDFKIGVCPATKNVVTCREHLEDNAAGRDDNRGGDSYESRGWMYKHHIYNQKRIAEDGVDPGLDRIPKSLNNIRKPAQVCLISDADDEGINNWPDKGNNHEADGVNIGYCDGHASWTPTGRQLMSAFLSGYYEPGLDNSLYTKYGVTRTTPTINGQTWVEFKW